MVPAASTIVAGVHRERVLGNPVHAVSRPDAIRLVLERVRESSPGAFVCLTNAHTAVESRRSGPLRDAAERAFLSVPDGMPLVWVLRRRGHRTTQKVTGIEFMPAVAAAGIGSGLRHYLYGGAPGVAEAAALSLRTMVPGAQVVGASTPPVSERADWSLDDLRASIAETQPDILWVGLGAPKQEIWMARVAGSLDVPVMVGVGAAFDFLAGTKRAAPRFLSDIGLEWLFRLLSEPRRLARRYVAGNSLFVYFLARDALGGRAGRGTS